MMGLLSKQIKYKYKKNRKNKLHKVHVQIHKKQKKHKNLISMRKLVSQVHWSLVMMCHKLSLNSYRIITIRLSIVRARSPSRPSSMLVFRKNIRVSIRRMIGCLILIVKVLILNRFLRINNNLSCLMWKNKVNDQE